VLDHVGLVAVSFVLMEPVTWAVHRYVMHGFGWALHRSHHQPRRGRLEANDAYPAAFALVVGAALAVGFNRPGWGWLVPVGVGITLYGAAYGLVHDGYIHRRIPMLRHSRALDVLATAHAVHHRTGGEPLGMLAPYVPRGDRAVVEA
jgi:beta-carotene 3-hydroxylase